MFNNGEQTWARDDLFTEITFENVADVRSDRQRSIIEIFVRHPDLSETFPLGRIYCTGSPISVLETVEEIISDVKCRLEVGVSDAGCASFPSHSVRDSLYRACLAFARLVRRGGLGG